MLNTRKRTSVAAATANAPIPAVINPGRKAKVPPDATTTHPAKHHAAAVNRLIRGCNHPIQRSSRSSAAHSAPHNSASDRRMVLR